MKCKSLILKFSLSTAICSLSIAALAQTTNVTAATAANSAVPRLINYSGILKNSDGKTLTTITGVTFLLYKDEQGGAPLWLETQNLTPDRTGHYSVQLGTTSANGLPSDLFVSGEARWLAVQVVNDAEQARVLLVAVPYAMKAADAETIGGLPPSAFVLAEPSSVTGRGATSSAGRASTPNAPAPGTITGSGTAGFLPKFTGAATIGNSAVFQSGSSPSAKIGINTNAPRANLDVNGSANVRGNVSATGAVSASTYNIGSNLFAFGSNTNTNAFLGFSGNQTMTGTQNTAIGNAALSGNFAGCCNTATGESALSFNFDGNLNTATGRGALRNNVGGSNNTADGSGALFFNFDGSSNTGLGSFAGLTKDGSNGNGSNDTFVGAGTSYSTGTLTNATAIGADAEVDQSNSLVLGSINGVNGATADTVVGIGTTTPFNSPIGPPKLNIVGNNTFVPLVVQSPSTFGTWMLLNNTSSGGKDWAILSTASGNGEGAGNLGITDFGAGGHIILESNVGIGIAPDNTLTVNGSADKPGGGFWGVFSDRRLKTLNGDFTSGLEQVLKIKPVRYRYKDENALGIKDREEHVGLVAQEVQRVIPEAVTENSKGYLVVNNEPILWTMLNAIKEQQGLIDKQENQIKLQQARIAQLASQVRTMRASLRASAKASGPQSRFARREDLNKRDDLNRSFQ